MDTGVTESIKSRRDALYHNYDLPGEAKRKAEALFSRMELFGKECKNKDEFERKFTYLTMNREYNNLFVEFTAYVRDSEEITFESEITADSKDDINKFQKTKVGTDLLNHLKRVGKIFQKRRKKSHAK